MGHMNSYFGFHNMNFEDRMEILGISECMFNMFDLLSAQNKELIKDVLYYRCIDCTELYFNLMRLFYDLYKMIIPCRNFYCVLNSSITSYLMTVINKSEKCTYIEKYLNFPANVPHKLPVKLLGELKKYILHNSSHKYNIYTSVEIPVEFIVSSKMEKLSEFKIHNISKIISVDESFQSFILPLEQDYTKSSKGYSSLIAIADKNVHFCNETEDKESDDKVPLNECIIKTESFKRIYDKTKSNSNQKELTNEINLVDSCYNSLSSSCGDSDSDTSKELDSKITHDIFIKSLNNENITFFKNCDSNKNNFINSNFDYSDSIVVSKSYSAKTKNNLFTYGNDSDNSIAFFENCTGNNSWYDDDSDDSIVFSEEIVDLKQTAGSEINVMQIFISPADLDDSGSSEDTDDWDKEYENDSVSFFENHSFEFGMCNLPEPTISQSKLSVPLLNSQGYVNACFEDDDNDVTTPNNSYMRYINDKWNDEMKDVSNEPHESQKVSFMPLPDLVSVHSFEADDDGYRYSVYVLDQLRFQNRIRDFEEIISPYLTTEHRANIYHQFYVCDR